MSETQIIDRTVIESADGHLYWVELREGDVIAFADADTDEPIATFSTDAVVTVTGGLWLDMGANRFIDQVGVGNVKQFCRI
jgi:hypothetical protein